MPHDQLLLTEEPEAVPRARRFVVDHLQHWGLEEVADGAELATSELVTNALLHVGPPVRLVLSARGEGVRIEVHDSSRATPVRPKPDTGAMTGRGLALVDALAARWGVEATTTGKVVWTELTSSSVLSEAPAAGDIESLLAAFDEGEETAAVPRFTVRLGDVPTDLLLEAKTHIDSLARELTLTTAGALAGLTADLPAQLGRLITAVVSEFATARDAIKRQALEAAARGEGRTSLTLTLPAEAADAGERYLAALEQADVYARSARLLTLETPATHRSFRRWYVSSLVAALRRAAAGQPPEPAASFESFLLGEVEHLAELQRTSERAARLQRVTAALARALSPRQVAQTLVRESLVELGAHRGALLIERRTPPALEILSGVDSALAELSPATPSGGPVAVDELPAYDAVRTGEPVWVESPRDRDARYPRLAELEPDAAAACAVPLTVAAHRVGVLRLSFTEAHVFDGDERGFLTALAATAAQALEREELHQSRARMADRLGRLQTVSAALAGARDVAEVAESVTEQAADLLGAAYGALCVLEDDGHTLTVVHMRTPSPGTRAAWRHFDVNDQLPAAEAVRTGRTVAVESIAERDARWPALSGLPPHFEHALITLPLTASGSVLGSLSLSFASPRRVDASELEVLGSLANICAQAVHRARADEQLRRANRRLAFLADASAQLAASLDIRATLTRIATLAVPEFADWCVVHLLDGDRFAPLAIAHVDRSKVATVWEVARRWPPRVGDEAGVGHVVRTGEPMLVPEITDEMLASDSTRDPEHTRLLRELGFASIIVAPLRARARTLGALTLILAESARHYDEADLTFAVDLARRAGTAIDLATAFDRLSEGGADPRP